MRRHGGIETRRHTLREHIRRKMLEHVRRHIEQSFIGEIQRLAKMYEETRRDLQAQNIRRSTTILFEFFRRLIDEWRESLINRIREGIRTRIAFFDFLLASSGLFKNRARILFEVERRMFFDRDKTIVRIRDEMLMSLPQDVRDAVINGLLEASRGKYPATFILQRYPILRWFLQRYILYYQRYPCKHSSYAIRITPVTLHFTKGYRITYYVMRWIRVSNLKHDPYLEVARHVDLYFTMQVRKPYWDILNTMTHSGSGLGDTAETVTIARNDRREAMISVPLRRAILQPHHIRRAFTKAIGMPEMYDVASHCSIYGIIERRRKTARMYEFGVSRDMIAKRKLRKITDITWRMGLRG